MVILSTKILMILDNERFFFVPSHKIIVKTLSVSGTLISCGFILTHKMIIFKWTKKNLMKDEKAETMWRFRLLFFKNYQIKVRKIWWPFNVVLSVSWGIELTPSNYFHLKLFMTHEWWLNIENRIENILWTDRIDTVPTMYFLQFKYSTIPHLWKDSYKFQLKYMSVFKPTIHRGILHSN